MRPMAGPGSNRYPLFAATATGLRVVFQSDRDGDEALYWQAADGTAPARLTRPRPGESHAPESWCEDTLLFSVTRNYDVSLWTMSLHVPTPMPFGDVHSAYPTGARFSPDGRWVAYATEEEMIGDGTALYVQPFPATGVRHRLHVNESPDIPNTTPHKPVWSRDGRELFYVPRLGGFEVVRIMTSPTFSFGPPMPVPRPFAPGAPRFRTLFDMMSDGRFVAMIPVGQPEDAATSGPGIQVVLDWFDELQDKVPI
jgi:Tol biopolymer transport system component